MRSGCPPKPWRRRTCFGGFRRTYYRDHGCEAVGLHIAEACCYNPADTLLTPLPPGHDKAHQHETARRGIREGAGVCESSHPVAVRTARVDFHGVGDGGVALPVLRGDLSLA